MFYYHDLFRQLFFEGVTNGKKMSREHFKATSTSEFSKTFEKCSSYNEFLDILKKEGIGRRPTGINQA